MNSLIPVVLCGGSGTRLWPLSRETEPKQFLRLDGGLSLLQQTLKRLAFHGLRSMHVAPPVVVTHNEHRFLTAAQAKEAAVDLSRIILEPVARNTAPALTLAALYLRDQGLADAVMLVSPSDHLISNEAALAFAVEQAYPHAHKGAVVVFGIEPTRADTGYGYIELDKRDPGAVTAVRRFVEKPSAEVAAHMLEMGGFKWNSGMFMLQAGVWLHLLHTFEPEMLAWCEQSYAEGTEDLDFFRPAQDPLHACKANSIDYAVMERLQSRPMLYGENTGMAQLLAVPLDAGWTDLGAWNSVWEVLPHDEQNNACQGDVLQLECHDSLICGSHRLVVGLGLNDMVVVETPDAVLVSTKAMAQDVKRVVQKLKSSHNPLANAHRKVIRPWGYYDSVFQANGVQVKKIAVNPGASLSLQMHHHRAEHWIVLHGLAEVTNGEKVFVLQENESTFIPKGHVHRLHNPGPHMLEIIEVQTGHYLGEDDIVRFEDNYGRCAVAQH